jgi:hypothetical protein
VSWNWWINPSIDIASFPVEVELPSADKTSTSHIQRWLTLLRLWLLNRSALLVRSGAFDLDLPTFFLSLGNPGLWLGILEEARISPICFQKEAHTKMKDISPGNHFQADLLLNDRKVSSSSWHSLVRLGRSTWLIDLSYCMQCQNEIMFFGWSIGHIAFPSVTVDKNGAISTFHKMNV